MTIRKLFPQIIAISFSVIVLGLGSVFAQKTWTLEECIVYALENNIQIKQSRLQSETAEINLLQSKLDFAPSANMGTNLNYNWGRNIDPVTNIYNNNQTLNITYVW